MDFNKIYTPEYLDAIADLMKQESDMRKEEPMPEFKDADEAYEWMQRKLNKSWVDDIPGVKIEGLDVEATGGPKANYGSGNAQAGTHDAPPAVDLSLADFEKMFNGDSS